MRQKKERNGTRARTRIYVREAGHPEVRRGRWAELTGKAPESLGPGAEGTGDPKGVRRGPEPRTWVVMGRQGRGKRVWTLNRSPHGNKTAREQFGRETWQRKLRVQGGRPEEAWNQLRVARDHSGTRVKRKELRQEGPGIK